MIPLTDIIIVKSDPIKNQSSIRAMQIFKSLSKKYRTIALGWDRQSKSIELDEHDKNLELFNLKAPYGYEPHGAIRLMASFPVFWTWIFVKLCIHRPKTIHACDLATIFPCYLYKLIFRKKLVFDVLDRYGMTYVPKDRNLFFRIFYFAVNYFEEGFAKHSDVLVTVTDKMFLSFRKKPRNCIAIMNCPEDHLISGVKLETTGFKLLFTGAIRRGRGLETLCDIVSNLNDTHLIITGKIKNAELKDRVDQISNIEYRGFLDRKELLDLEISCDVMIALYDLNIQSQYHYGMANKVLEAMMCGLPIITNISHELVNETNCGIVVEYENVQQITDAIATLRDNPKLRTFYGTNGRKAFLEKYNWTRMEQILYGTYDELLQSRG